MHSSPLEIKVLEIGQSAPDGVKEPPRNSQITDTFRYIGNPDRFCRENLVKYGPIFKTSVFGGTTVFVGSRIANEMIFNGDNKYSDIALPQLVSFRSVAPFRSAPLRYAQIYGVVNSAELRPRPLE